MITPQYRALAGLGLIGAAVVVAVVGWLGVSGESEVAFQLPYFASAAVAALMLLGLGSALLLSVQLERDRSSLAEMEMAVRELAAEVARLADETSTPRGRRSGPEANGDHRAPLRAVGR